MTSKFQALLFAACTAVGCAGTVSGTATVDTPPMVEVQGGVQVVENSDEPIFYSDNSYWLYRDDRWYRSNDYRGGWAYVEAPPVRVREIREPRAYVHYRANVEARRNDRAEQQRIDEQRQRDMEAQRIKDAHAQEERAHEEHVQQANEQRAEQARENAQRVKDAHAQEERAHEEHVQQANEQRAEQARENAQRVKDAHAEEQRAHEQHVKEANEQRQKALEKQKKEQQQR